MKILFFIGTLRSGGKERRLIELLTYLKGKKKYVILVILAFDQIEYPTFQELNINFITLNKKANCKDPKIFFQIDKIVKEFKPHIIHTWGSMQTFYMIPSSLFRHIPIVNSQITSAPPTIKRWSFDNIIDKINFSFSKMLLANSYEGLIAYKANHLKISHVIYNGVNLKRFEKLPVPSLIKNNYGINTKFTVIMVASFTQNKDYGLFYRVAKLVIYRMNDVSFIGVGAPGNDDKKYKRLVALTENNPKILFPGRINDVEALVNACDICVLFSNKMIHGEGISNAIIEYLALGKTVIANDAGGTKEIVKHNVNGYLISDETEKEVANIIIDLINNPRKRTELGNNGKHLIENEFTIERMGREFEDIYCLMLNHGYRIDNLDFNKN